MCWAVYSTAWSRPIDDGQAEEGPYMTARSYPEVHPDGRIHIDGLIRWYVDQKASSSLPTYLAAQIAGTGKFARNRRNFDVVFAAWYYRESILFRLVI